MGLPGKDAQHPFFRPLWIRIALVAFCAAWSLWELYEREMFWAVIVGAATVYAAWTFLIAYDPDPVDAAKARKEERP